MRYSVLLTVYNRPTEVLLATFRQLARSLDVEDEVVIVDDGSSFSYGAAHEYAKAVFTNLVWRDIPRYDAFRIDGGYNNPARAFNAALELATGDGLFVMSSDVLVTPKAVARAKSFNLEEMAFTPLVIDIDTGAQYCGPMRCFPMPWFLACSTKIAKACGGWDENYLGGCCYEDNDFVGRLMLQTGRFVGDWGVAVYHQSHDQPAYNVKDPKVLAANDRNRIYTHEKWGGIPFGSPEDACFDVRTRPHASGIPVYECKYYETKLQDVIAATKRRVNEPVL